MRWLLHDTDNFVGSDYDSFCALACGTFGILQCQPQLLSQVVHRRPLALPCAIGFEAERADAAAPRRDHAANRAEVGATGVLLVDLLQHVRRDADERAEGGRRLDAVLAAVPRRFEDARDLLEVVDEELLRLLAEFGALAC